MSGEPIYRLWDVRHGYGGPFALTLDALDVFSGEVLGLIGPTGAGKSTLLRLLGGVESPSEGGIRFRGHRLDTPTVPLAVRRRITMAFQRPLMLAGTVQSNVEYGLRLRGLPRRRPKAEELLDRLDLAGIAAQPARTLSSGQQQLVALARALVIEPEALLLDEPTAHLDPSAVARVEAVVTEANRRRGLTVIWATHNLFQARRAAHRVGLLLNGQLVEMAPAGPFFASPRDPRTASFVRGEMIY